MTTLIASEPELPALHGDGFWEERMKTMQQQANAPDTPEVWHAPQAARKVGGSYQADGFIVSRFKTRAGLERVVFEFVEPAGMLHIFSADQVVPISHEGTQEGGAA